MINNLKMFYRAYKFIFHFFILTQQMSLLRCELDLKSFVTKHRKILLKIMFIFFLYYLVKLVLTTVASKYAEPRWS